MITVSFYQTIKVTFTDHIFTCQRCGQSHQYSLPGLKELTHDDILMLLIGKQWEIFVPIEASICPVCRFSGVQLSLLPSANRGVTNTH